MTARIVRGAYKIKQVDGGWRRGTIVAGQRIKMGDGDWLEWLECLTPLKIVRPDGMLLLVVPTAPSATRFMPFELMGTFDVRRP